jgi:hypothetical protein
VSGVGASCTTPHPPLVLRIYRRFMAMIVLVSPPIFLAVSVIRHHAEFSLLAVGIHFSHEC